MKNILVKPVDIHRNVALYFYVFDVYQYAIV